MLISRWENCLKEIKQNKKRVNFLFDTYQLELPWHTIMK